MDNDTRQQITTAAELDALPATSIARTPDAQIWERRGSGWDCLSEDGTGGTYDSHTVLYQTLPPMATVLFRPDAPTPTPAECACASLPWRQFWGPRPTPHPDCPATHAPTPAEPTCEHGSTLTALCESMSGYARGIPQPPHGAPTPADEDREALASTEHPDPEQAGFVAEALACADAGDAGHWPTVAGYLADEVRRLRVLAHLRMNRALDAASRPSTPSVTTEQRQELIAVADGHDTRAEQCERLAFNEVQKAMGVVHRLAARGIRGALGIEAAR